MKTESNVMEKSKTGAKPIETAVLGFMAIVLLSLGVLVSASPADPGHSAGVVSAGTFEAGNFSFPNWMNVSGGFIANYSTLYVDPDSLRVGIGTTGPSTRLHINITNSTGGWSGVLQDALRITNATGQEYFFVNGSTGRVGIGTKTPKLGLQVEVSKTAYGFTSLGVKEPNSNGWVYLYADNTQTPAIIWGNNTAELRFGIENTIGAGFSEKMRINSSGFVGIGATNPSTKLHINVTNSTGGWSGVLQDALRVTNATGEEYFFINGSTGNVGIGTTNPITTLEVSRSTTAPASGDSTWDGSGAQLHITSTAANAQGVGSAITFRATGAGGSLLGYAAIKGAIEDTGQNTGYISFLTRTGGEYATERMRISSGGNLGIGTSGPSYMLEIKDPDKALNVSDFLFVNSTNIGIGDSNPETTFDIDSGNVSIDGGAFLFDATNDRLGIGTTSPSHPLEVSNTTQGLSFNSTGGSAHSPIINTTGTTNLTITSSNGSVIIRLG